MKKLASVCIVASVIICGCASTPITNENSPTLSSKSDIKAISRLREGWGRVRLILLDAHTYVPEPAQDISKEDLVRYVKKIDSLIETEEWSKVWPAWMRDDNAMSMVGLGINWRYRGDSDAGIREYERWHWREFDKAGALLTHDSKIIKTTKYWYGTLKRTPKPEFPG